MIAVLEALHAAGDAEVHGWTLIKATGLGGPTVYKLLRQIADWGWATARWADQPVAGGAPRRRYFRMTAPGRARAWELLVSRRKVVTLAHGTVRYGRLLDGVREDAGLVAAMWADAECRPEELDVPGTSWTVALDEGVPAAWCAARVVDGVLKCHSNYEVRAFRGRGFYEAAYRVRHAGVVVPGGRAAVTYLFAQPVALHEADGWCRTGVSGVGEVGGHRWWELRRGVG